MQGGYNWMFRPIPKDSARRAIDNQTGEIISRRQYDKTHRFKDTPFKTPEEQREYRREAGIPPGPAKGHKGRPSVRKGPGDWKRINFNGQSDWLTYIEVAIPHNAMVVVNVYGTSSSNSRSLDDDYVHWFNILASTRQQDVIDRIGQIPYEYDARRVSVLWRKR